MIKPWLLPIVVFMLIICLQILAFSQPYVYELLLYKRLEIIDLELWRIFSGQFLHVSFEHAAVNILSCLVLFIIAKDLKATKDFWLSMAFGSLVVGLGLLAFYPNLFAFAGMSGFLNGIAVVIIYRLSETNKIIGWLFLLGFTGKLVYEQIYGSLNSAGFRVALESHLLGYLSGMVYLLVSKIVRNSKVL